MGAIFFGDINKDSITYGVETVSFSKFVKDNEGYSHLANLDTDPSVYYLPAASRLFLFEPGLDDKDEELLKRYKNTPYFNNQDNGSHSSRPNA